MPGIIRVSVLEAVDLPEVFTDGKLGKDVTAKVTLGPRLFKTRPVVPEWGRIESWNSDFSFPVMNLRDKLVISICDSEDHSVTQTAIEIPSIIQKGCRDEFVSLNQGGRIHLKMRFILAGEERKKIEVMRVAALKRREEAERHKKTVVFQTIQDAPEIEPKEFPVSGLGIAEVDLPATFSLMESKEHPNVPSSFDSYPKLPAAKPESEQASMPVSKLAPKLMFNYAKAIGLQSGSKATEKCSNLVLPDISSIGDVNSGVGTVNKGVKDTGEVDSSGSRGIASSLVKNLVDNVSQSMLIPPGRSDNLINNGDMCPEVKTGRKRAEEAGYGLSGSVNIDTALLLPTRSDGAASFADIPTNTPLTQHLMNVDKADNGDRKSERQPVSKSAGNAREVGSSGSSNLDPSVADASPGIRYEAASMVNSAFKTTLQVSGISSSGIISLRMVKARLKGSFSRVISTRSSRRTASNSVVARTQPLVPRDWLQDCARKAITNVKGCFGAMA